MSAHPICSNAMVSIIKVDMGATPITRGIVPISDIYLAALGAP